MNRKSRKIDKGIQENEEINGNYSPYHIFTKQSFIFSMQELPHTSGSVIVTEMGAVGEPIVGTYSITADPYAGENPSGNEVAISGTFSVTRGSNR